MIKEFAFQKVKGYHPGYQKSRVYASSDTKENLNFVSTILTKDSRPAPFHVNAIPHKVGTLLRLLTKVSPPGRWRKKPLVYRTGG